MKRRIVRIEDIADTATLWEGWINASCGGGKDRRKDVIAYSENITQNIERLSAALLDGTWQPDKGRTFMLWSEGKWRRIHTVGVEDRIVHYALVKAFNLSEHFVRRTFGSIRGRGTLKANKQVRRDVHNIGAENVYVVKLDVRKYYPSIDKSKLMGLIRRHYKGERAIALYEKVINAYEPKRDRGISIGGLPSQDGGNFYLTPLDRHAIYNIGCKHYTRYVDDITMLFNNKTEAVGALEAMQRFIATLGLEFGKVSVYPLAARRIDFCGYAIGTDGIRLRRGIKQRMIRKIRSFGKRPQPPMTERNSICSYLGYAIHAHTFTLLNNIRNEQHYIFNRIHRCAKSHK